MLRPCRCRQRRAQQWTFLSSVCFHLSSASNHLFFHSLYTSADKAAFIFFSKLSFWFCFSAFLLTVFTSLNTFVSHSLRLEFEMDLMWVFCVWKVWKFPSKPQWNCYVLFCFHFLSSFILHIFLTRPFLNQFQTALLHEMRQHNKKYNMQRSWSYSFKAALGRIFH